LYPFLFSNLGSIKDYESGETWKRDVFFKEINIRISYFKKVGIKEKEKVLLCHGNNSIFFADLFALWCLNATAVCLDNNVGISEFNNIVKSCKSKYVIIKDKKPEKLKSYRNSLLKYINTNKCYAFKEKKSSSITFKPHFENIALILFTSGTTGVPKGVVHTFRTLIAKWITLKEHVPLKYLKKSLCLLPTNFGHGLICNCLYPLLNGKDLLILPKFNITLLSKINKILDQNAITFMSSVPSVWKIILELSKQPKNKSLKLITCGSAPLSSFLWSKIQKWALIKRVWNTYGITETGSWIAGTKGNAVVPFDGKTGMGWGTNILISKESNRMSKNTSLLESNFYKKRNIRGYIWVQTPCLMQGYLNQTKATNSVVLGSWFFTGDIGYLDSKNNLVLTGRVRNEINTGGIKVTPEDIDIILEKHSNIEESCTFGLPDKLAGEIVATAIVLKNNKSLHSSELNKWIKKFISDYKSPKVWYKVKEIPKTTRGKINRDEVAKFCVNLEKMK
tara:strand:- start:369 stop:1886 length:1518 start_codon:yes stop_codon:yes gene_type:complete